MITFGVIILLLFMVLIALDVYEGFKPSKYVESLTKELEMMKTMKTWQYYLWKGVIWFVDLGVIGYIIAALAMIGK